ncbi:hypothetical protein SAMN05216466_106212 [Paraburkholderia phenazinium]|uniref:Uncharacterized protein n=1 Tax=Paraburkholderia phenazinium TaxID=60549 RepID=A0A1G7YJS2_9BURK|nr:hypothetical protein [Paraburkholderia phenazinium]SDG96535.1 hypothetical protein SAMN05216466_106212 [Paraburkholderia phenazinium]
MNPNTPSRHSIRWLAPFLFVVLLAVVLLGGYFVLGACAVLFVLLLASLAINVPPYRRDQDQERVITKNVQVVEGALERQRSGIESDRPRGQDFSANDLKEQQAALHDVKQRLRGERIDLGVVIVVLVLNAWLFSVVLAAWWATGGNACPSLTLARAPFTVISAMKATGSRAENAMLDETKAATCFFVPNAQGGA